MSGGELQMHGRNHRPGGSDPIPGLITDAVYPIGSFPAVEPGPVITGIDNSGWALSSVTADQYGTWKWQASTDGNYFVRGFRLGPYGSRWAVALAAERNTDCGKLTFAWATGTENAPNEGYAVPDGMLDSPWNVNNSYAQFVDFATQDLYSGSAGIVNPYQVGDFRIKGVDGATLTALTDPDPDLGSGVVAADGGAGIWWLRVRINGKNASSSAYRCAIRGMWILRLTHDGFPA